MKTAAKADIWSAGAAVFFYWGNCLFAGAAADGNCLAGVAERKQL